jgi:hypothetical protein
VDRARLVHLRGVGLQETLAHLALDVPDLCGVAARRENDAAREGGAAQNVGSAPPRGNAG